MLLIKNGRVIDPLSGFDEIADILIEGGKIKRIEKDIDTDCCEETLDAEGMVVCPGLVDIHVHFRDPGFTYKEDIRTGSEAAARGGFTTVVCMANTKPVVDNEETLKYILDECRKSKINVLQTASITKGLRGEELTDMERLKKLGAAGFTDDGIPLTDGKTVLLAMKKVRSLDMPLSLHEEDPSYIGMAGINEGEISEKLGVKGASHLAEDVMVSRDCILALSTGAKINIQHLSSGISVELIRWAKSKGANVTAEVSPHHFSMTEKDVIEHGANSKMNPPLRTEADRIKIIEGLKDDTIEIIATDHAPHSREEKEKGIEKAPSGIIGLETSLALGITNLVNKNHIELMKLIEKMTIKPARLYSLQSGFLKEGADADITIFNPVEKWIVKDFSSKSSNSPFIGQELCGKVKFTICRGNIVYRDKADI